MDNWNAIMVSRRRALTMTASAIGAAGLAALPRGAAAAAGSARPGRIAYGACVRPEPLAAERDYRTAIQTNCQQITPEGGLVWGHPMRLTIGQIVLDLELIAKATDPTDWQNVVERLPL